MDETRTVMTIAHRDRSVARFPPPTLHRLLYNANLTTNQNIIDSVKASLKRLQMDYIDVLHCM